MKNSKKTIYRRITENIQNKIGNFKDGKLTKEKLNDQLTLNIVSLCKFIQKNEEEKKQKELLEQENDDDGENEKDLEEEVNDTILDVFVPYSRLTRTLQLKLESINIPTIDENEEFEKDLLENDFLMNEHDNEENEEKKKKDLTNLIDEEDDDNIINDNFQGNNNHLNFLDESMMNMSLFNQPLENDNYDPFTIGRGGMNNIINNNINNNNNNFINNSINTNINIHDINKNQNEFINNENPRSNSKYNKNNKSNVEMNEEIKTACREFDGILKERIIVETIKEMNIDYLRYMYSIYKKMKESCDAPNKELNEYKGLKFINQFKSFVLEIGISDKKFYEQCIREIIYNKNMFEFSEFLECFRKLLNLKYDQTFLKYKFLFYITERKHEDYFEEEDLNKFYNLLQNCKKIYDPDIYNQIKQKLLIKYKKFFPKDTKFYTRKLSLILEQFFDLK